ncbi:hypothetical protein EK904_010012 [Melospiza melodia maxima]|nr:hypothetical protein EK904_010012 [Melospiza melodia maxima]
MKYPLIDSCGMCSVYKIEGNERSNEIDLSVALIPLKHLKAAKILKAERQLLHRQNNSGKDCIYLLGLSFTYSCVFHHPYCGGLHTTICFGQPEHLLEKHHSLSADMEKTHQISTHVLTRKPNESFETKGLSIPDIIEIRPLLPGEVNAWFPAEMLQTQTYN